MIEATTMPPVAGARRSAMADEADEFTARPDEWLLSRFLDAGGEESRAAFDALVARHGPAVLAACRRVLGHREDAEDAFQATFLSLARKAATIRDGRSLPAWLHGVATRYALHLRARRSRRLGVERDLLGMTRPVPHSGGPPWELARDEIAAMLHQEVGHLPEKYRAPVVLCYLEGRTNEEVAGLLRWPVGTVKGRLSRARELLRTRLMRRGLALAAAMLVRRLGRPRAFGGAASGDSIPPAADSRPAPSPGPAVVADTPGPRWTPGHPANTPAPSMLRSRPRWAKRGLALVALFVAAGAFVAIASTAGHPTGISPIGAGLSPRSPGRSPLRDPESRSPADLNPRDPCHPWFESRPDPGRSPCP